mmetsp:Transcript_7772/g.23510  ORF Transcript_7772/g.23510 Transcript_7772/m.23510 type:complete len:226 (-) Transcript_7772:137-814(-)|eukprot:CAMPEP_0198736494 /NCGR_PEP_ID=MMETSP1475-20131203/66045_1 /TAXON_ID= ORGANISM="Unidentified sp., Strain CCMP1999" /NCGR_SAMPLE_ID=MMETSP1475 /ASSEMBLY_ACC=CAM_ASM_001111 /LENGTH=225 /DNA_ID=CAMNT_0044500311 /DNA_START=247 /DNA_END=924 /DNA_ORIENTATION=-
MELGVKRRFGDADVAMAAENAAMGCDVMCRQGVLRTRRNLEELPLESLDICAVLRADINGYARYEGRCGVLERLGMSEECAKRMYVGSNCNIGAFLKVVDVNQLQQNLSALFYKLELKGVRLHTINVKSFTISASDNRRWLLDTGFRRVDDAISRVLTANAVESLFAPHEKVGMSILYGSGVRDVLLTDWCRAYNLVGHKWPNPTVIVLTSRTTGKTFLVPAYCF